MNTIQRHPLNAFADRWKLDGDYLRCRCCNRPQQVSFALHDFPHAAGCKGAKWEQDPWKTLSSLLTAQISKAKFPENSAMAGSTVTQVRLNPAQRACLSHLADRTLPNGEMCVPFAPISRDTGLPRDEVRRSVRALARKGLAEFHSGLSTEDGNLAGSGYCITPAGIAENANGEG
jgi:hypothetical protein